MARVARALPPALKCIASTGIAVGTSTEVRYTEDVRYWEGPLSEVPLYRVLSIIDVLGYDGQNFSFPYCLSSPHSDSKAMYQHETCGYIGFCNGKGMVILTCS